MSVRRFPVAFRNSRALAPIVGVYRSRVPPVCRLQDGCWDPRASWRYMPDYDLERSEVF